MREFLRTSWLVLAASFVFGLLLAVTYTGWQPRIEANKVARLQRGIRSILTDADSLRADTLAIPAAAGMGSTIVYTGLRADGQPVGYVYTAEGTGFQDRIELLVGVDPQLARYRGISVLFAAETPGFGDAIRDSAIFGCQFNGTPTDPPLIVVKGPDSERPRTDDHEIVSITGATITSESVTAILNRRIAELRPVLQREGVTP